MLGVLICGLSHVIMIGGAAPAVLQAGNGTAPFMISLILLAVGAGIFKPNVSPTLLDQFKHQQPYTKILTSNERVVVDPEVTVQRIMLVFYGFINIGAFFGIATVYSEKYVGFWLAFLLPGIAYFALPALLWYLYYKLTTYPPDGSALSKVWKIFTVAVKYSKGAFWRPGFWDVAQPSVLAERGITTFNGNAICWTDKDVDDVKRTMVACAVFLYFPIYNLNDGGMLAAQLHALLLHSLTDTYNLPGIGSVATSQGSTLTTNGAPNDLLVRATHTFSISQPLTMFLPQSHFNPITIIVFVPLLSYVIYPALRRYNIKFGRISRKPVLLQSRARATLTDTS